ERSKGVNRVSVPTIVIWFIGTPNSSAAIWLNMVRAPWPTSVLPAMTITLPSASKRTSATDTGIASESDTPTAMPRPQSRSFFELTPADAASGDVGAHGQISVDRSGAGSELFP